MNSKKGALSAGLASGILMTVIAIIILFQVLADTSEDLGYAADNITAKGAEVYPLTSFFKKKGVIFSSCAAACC